MCALVERQWDASFKSSSSPGKKLCMQLNGIRNECSSCECSIGKRAVNLKDLVFVDETGCNLAMTTLCSRYKGTRAYNDAPYQRGSNLTLIGAMALRGLVGEMTTDALAFKTCETGIGTQPLAWGLCGYG